MKSGSGLVRSAGTVLLVATCTLGRLEGSTLGSSRLITLGDDSKCDGAGSGCCRLLCRRVANCVMAFLALSPNSRKGNSLLGDLSR